MRLFHRFPPRTFSRLLGALLLHACTFVAAQSVPADITHWPSASAVEPGMKLQIQTRANRARSTLCTVQSFNDHELSCSRPLGLKAVVFQKDEIVSIATQPYHYSTIRAFLIALGAGGGIVAGGIFLAAISLGGAVALYVIGGFILATSPVVLLDPEDDIPSKILYLNLEPSLAP